MKDLLRASTFMLGMLRLVGTKTCERMLFHSRAGLQFDRREVKKVETIYFGLNV